MTLPDINFFQIRPHDGSRHTGFEELITQLASLEKRPAGAAFVRKGRGGDGGIECFVRLTNGDERGWQAKYVFDWDASLEAQLDKSMEAALAKHPRLTELIVCIPFDLPDGRPNQGKSRTQKKSARQKWEAWKAGWEQKAGDQQRALTISLWDSGALSGRLIIDSPAYSGRLLYWFTADRDGIHFVDQGDRLSTWRYWNADWQPTRDRHVRRLGGFVTTVDETRLKAYLAEQGGQAGLYCQIAQASRSAIYEDLTRQVERIWL